MPAEKRYELIFERRDAYLYVLLKAETVDRTTALDYLAEIWAEAAELKTRQILLKREVSSLVTDETCEIMDAGKLGSGVRMAFVDNSQLDHLPLEFNIYSPVPITNILRPLLRRSGGWPVNRSTPNLINMPCSGVKIR